jgi:hypothetical protein
MSCEEFILGQRPRFQHWFYLGKVLTNPTLVKFIYQRPDVDDPLVLVYGVDVELVRESTGKFYVDLLLDAAGSWTWRYESAGVVDDADQGDFTVAAENPVG